MFSPPCQPPNPTPSLPFSLHSSPTALTSKPEFGSEGRTYMRVLVSTLLSLAQNTSLTLFPHLTSSPQPKKYCGTETRVVCPLQPFHLPLASFIPFIPGLIYVPRAEAEGCLRCWAIPEVQSQLSPAYSSQHCPPKAGDTRLSPINLNVLCSSAAITKHQHCPSAQT